ncbi:hypothetical protein FRC01_000259 [Tulasnella sp. 417]|nr:hypothetical protein FRC01_000259 [Tulasnella sp. 417]
MQKGADKGLEVPSNQSDAMDRQSRKTSSTLSIRASQTPPNSTTGTEKATGARGNGPVQVSRESTPGVPRDAIDETGGAVQQKPAAAEIDGPTQPGKQSTEPESEDDGPQQDWRITADEELCLVTCVDNGGGGDKDGKRKRTQSPANSRLDSGTGMTYRLNWDGISGPSRKENKKLKKKERKKEKEMALQRTREQLEQLQRMIMVKETEQKEVAAKLQEVKGRGQKAKENDIKRREQLQAIPLPVMHINGKDVNGGGMSRVGSAQFESMDSSELLNDEDFDNPNYGEPVSDLEDEDLNLAVSRKREIDPPSPERVRHTKSKRTSLHAPSPLDSGSPRLSLQAKTIQQLTNHVTSSRTQPPAPVLQPPVSILPPPSLVKDMVSNPEPGESSLSMPKQDEQPRRFCGEWKQSGQPGPVNNPRMPHWWNEVRKQAEVEPQWVKSYQKGYTARHPEHPGRPFIPRTPLLLLEIRCLKGETRPPFSVASQFMEMMKHIYGAHANLQLSHCTFDVESLYKPNTKLQAEAETFLSAQEECNVLITVDAHTFGNDGNINYSENHGTSLTILLWATLGKSLWSTIGRTHGRRILVPFVCGWIWEKPDQVRWLLALFQEWDLKQGESITSIPPLIDNLLGFSTTNLVTWGVATHTTGFLNYLLLGEDTFLDQVNRHLLTNPSLMETTGIVVGYMSKAGPHLQLASPMDIDRNFFGLPPPQRCGKCGGSLKLHFAKKHSAGKQTLLDRVRARCLSDGCRVTTPWYVTPGETSLPDSPGVFFWNLPLVKMEWEWLPNNMQEFRVLKNAAPLK